MGKTLYFECTSGISGDMTVAALLDLGADENVLRTGLASLGVSGYHLHINRVDKSGIAACDFDVILHAHSHAHKPDHDHSHAHSSDHDHSHAHKPDHDHAHRNLLNIIAIIDTSSITANAKMLAKKIFDVIAHAEAKVHGLPVEDVHFHEVGAVDSIVDIVGAAICIDNLGATRILCSPLREGTGMVKCQHGFMPIPAPATMEIIRANNIPLIITENKGEMVTPTGAGIVAAIADQFVTPHNMEIHAVGYGAGKRNFPHTANILRVCEISEISDTTAVPFHGDTIVKLECNLDDISGEMLAFACEKLFESGALDVWCSPIYMKKNRPGQLLSVIVSSDKVESALTILFKHTTTAGVRKSEHLRYTMNRRPVTLSTRYGSVEAKELVWGDIHKTQVEYESARILAEENNVSINQIFSSVQTKTMSDNESSQF